MGALAVPAALAAIAIILKMRAYQKANRAPAMAPVVD
jgi:hypothetical protein